MVQYFDMKRRTAIKTTAYLLLAALLAACLTGCTTWDNFRNAFIDKDPDDTPVIKIAIFEPFTGVDAKDAAAEVEGMELANELFQNVLDSRVELVKFDNKSDPVESVKAAQAIAEEGFSMVLGSYGNMLTIAASDTFRSAEIPAITATCTNPLITQTNEFYSRVCYIDSFEAKGAADFVYYHLEDAKPFVLYQYGDDYARAKVAEFTDYLKQLSGRSEVLTLGFDQTRTDFSDLIEEIARQEATAVYLPQSIELSNTIINQAREMGYSFTWIGTSEWEGIQTEDVCYTADYDPEAEQSTLTKYFNEAYAKKYGADKVPSQEAALGFDAYLLALAALREAGDASDGALIAQKITTISGLAGATGYMTMDANGDPIKSIVVKQIKNQTPETIYTVIPGREEKQ